MRTKLEEKLAIAKRAAEHWQAEYEKATSKIELMRFHVSKDVEKIIDELLKDKEGKMKVETTKERILAAASECSEAKKALITLFPDVFPDQLAKYRNDLRYDPQNNSCFVIRNENEDSIVIDGSYFDGTLPKIRIKKEYVRHYNDFRDELIVHFNPTK